MLLVEVASGLRTVTPGCALLDKLGFVEEWIMLMDVATATRGAGLAPVVANRSALANGALKSCGETVVPWGAELSELAPSLANGSSFARGALAGAGAGDPRVRAL